MESMSAPTPSQVAEAKAVVEAKDTDGRTTKLPATHRGHLETVRWLVAEDKADVEASAANARTALFAFAAASDTRRSGDPR